MATILYIGQYTEGTTSRMRGEKLKSIFSELNFEVIDTNIPYNDSSRLFRSIAFRYKAGPLIRRINQYVLERIKLDQYEMIWVDKGIYLERSTVAVLKGVTNKLVHFTPDPAFTFHRSKHFNASNALYDYLVTTKLFELELYKQNCKGKTIYVTQGYDKTLHYPRHSFSDKEGVAFIGHFEKERAETLQALLDNGIVVKLAGIKWQRFASRNRNNKCLIYKGTGVYGDDYSDLISSSLFALGSVSKWVPELHTTRTFEIPACGTALLTEANVETKTFFGDEDVIFYEDTSELISKIKYYSSHIAELQTLTKNGFEKVSKGYEYSDIMRQIIKEVKD